MVDDNLEHDEALRAANYESVKSQIDADVNRRVHGASHAVGADDAAVAEAAVEIKQRAVNDVVEINREVGRSRVVARISQIVDYIFFIIYGLLAIRLVLALFAARESAGFYKLIKTLTDPFYAPFRGLVPSPSTAEGFTLALPIVVAIIVYMLLHLAINGLLRILAHRKVSV